MTADELTRTLWHWVVRYSHRRWRWDFLREHHGVCFNTFKEAKEFADAPHPELIDFEVESIQKEAMPVIKVHPNAAPAKYRGHCTDEQILGY